MGSNTTGALLALLAFAIFATHDVIVKILGANYSPIQIIFFSVLFGFPWVTLMLIRDASSGNLRPRHPYWTAFRTLATTLTGVSAYYAFSTLPLAQVYAILFATPLLITIFAIPILGETVRIRRWVAVLVGLGGVLVVLKPGAQDLTLGHAAALVAAFGSAFASIIVRKIGKDERSVVLLIFPMMSNFVVMGALLGFVYKPMPVEHMGGIALMSLMALLGSALVIAAYKAGEAVIVAPMQYSQIIWATLFGALLFNETIERATILGAVIIIGSGLYIVLREGRANASENTPVLRTRTRTETGTSLRIGLLIRARKKRE
ncbi:MAG: DMT family transporter [Rhodobacteraceae bacterium]|jgi:drug/metabolite transporter (DMT)-like permease|uniref:DMT family transporter n=1 Tax=Planktotalea sp. TaxID=2029877 RepID=UPI0001838E7D|nr:DMT family transporter [Planktotalea sp.]EDZ44495.1 transporter, dme family [Rhodobacteraceae bacterium HTCC2083]MBT5822689.1 DMT family transporter [Paracoccaceae bacterium]MDG1082999.1 DMT family transporter [Planktotalea sp.]HCW86158.1 EamA/RhaT family transporter [Paracoccaceae bacterium]